MYSNWQNVELTRMFQSCLAESNAWLESMSDGDRLFCLAGCSCVAGKRLSLSLSPSPLKRVRLKIESKWNWAKVRGAILLSAWHPNDILASARHKDECFALSRQKEIKQIALYSEFNYWNLSTNCHVNCNANCLKYRFDRAHSCVTCCSYETRNWTHTHDASGQATNRKCNIRWATLISTFNFLRPAPLLIAILCVDFPFDFCLILSSWPK